MSQIRPTHFRLVGDAAAAPPSTVHTGHLAIANENLAASQLSIELNDPRWTLATIAYGKLQEGPLTPETRDELIKKATRLGLRPFDASLIIAIAQDQARHGRALEHAEPTLRLIRAPRPPETAWHGVRRWSMAVVCAALLSAAVLMLF
jgi:hypothetical protein